MSVRPKIKEIVENIDKFEAGTNDNGDLFYTGFGLRLIISFYDEFRETKPYITLEKEDDKIKGMYNKYIWLTGDEEAYIFDELNVKDKMYERKEKKKKQSDDLLNSITFKEENGS